MSRSYKKNPVMKSTSYKGKEKRHAGKIVRRAKDVGDGKVYKKLYCSYDINDYVSKSYTKKDMKRTLKHYRPHQIYMK